jgi:hypothetical protein
MTEKEYLDYKRAMNIFVSSQYISDMRPIPGTPVLPSIPVPDPEEDGEGDNTENP